MLDAALVLVLQCDLDADCAKHIICTVDSHLMGLIAQQNADGADPPTPAGGNRV